RRGHRRPRRRGAAGQLSAGAARVENSAGGSVESPVMERLWQDIRYAGRPFVRSPGFVTTAIATIAIGVGANGAIFSVVNPRLGRPLPYPRAGELVLVSGSNRQTGQSAGDATPANFLDWRARNHSFTGLAAFREASVTLTDGDHPERRRA